MSSCNQSVWCVLWKLCCKWDTVGQLGPKARSQLWTLCPCNPVLFIRGGTTVEAASLAEQGGLVFVSPRCQCWSQAITDHWYMECMNAHGQLQSKQTWERDSICPHCSSGRRSADWGQSWLHFILKCLSSNECCGFCHQIWSDLQGNQSPQRTEWPTDISMAPFQRKVPCLCFHHD